MESMEQLTISTPQPRAQTLQERVGMWILTQTTAKIILDTSNGLQNFSVADFVDYIQSLANMRAVNGGTMSRLNYATNILEENEINLGAATSRIMDADMARGVNLDG